MTETVRRGAAWVLILCSYSVFYWPDPTIINKKKTVQNPVIPTMFHLTEEQFMTVAGHFTFG